MLEHVDLWFIVKRIGTAALEWNGFSAQPFDFRPSGVS
jgi:hypothetical protein